LPRHINVITLKLKSDLTDLVIGPTIVLPATKTVRPCHVIFLSVTASCS